MNKSVVLYTYTTIFAVLVATLAVFLQHANLLEKKKSESTNQKLASVGNRCAAVAENATIENKKTYFAGCGIF